MFGTNLMRDSNALPIKGSFLSFTFRVCLCHTVLSVLCSVVVTCWERADILALLCVMFPCVCVSSPYGSMCQVWYLTPAMTHGFHYFVNG